MFAVNLESETPPGQLSENSNYSSTSRYSLSGSNMMNSSSLSVESVLNQSTQNDATVKNEENNNNISNPVVAPPVAMNTNTATAATEISPPNVSNFPGVRALLIDPILTVYQQQQQEKQTKDNADSIQQLPAHTVRSHSVFIGNLRYGVTVEGIVAVLSHFSNVRLSPLDLQLHYHHHSTKQRGSATLWVNNSSDQMAIVALHDRVYFDEGNIVLLGDTRTSLRQYLNSSYKSGPRRAVVLELPDPELMQRNAQHRQQQLQQQQQQHLPPPPTAQQQQQQRFLPQQQQQQIHMPPMGFHASVMMHSLQQQLPPPTVSTAAIPTITMMAQPTLMGMVPSSSNQQSTTAAAMLQAQQQPQQLQQQATTIPTGVIYALPPQVQGTTGVTMNNMVGVGGGATLMQFPPPTASNATTLQPTYFMAPTMMTNPQGTLFIFPKS